MTPLYGAPLLLRRLILRALGRACRKTGEALLRAGFRLGGRAA